MWTLASKDEEYLDIIEKISHEDINSIPESKGNGNGRFIPFMTESELQEYKRDQEPTWKKFYDKLKSI